MRTRSEEWKVLLEEFKPPHDQNGVFTEEMWKLISAAHADPILGSLYPAISMWSLTLSNSDVFSDIADKFPAISAADGEYRVLAWPHTQDICLFLTSDPAEAVQFAAEIIGKQL
ncbi:DUF6193 family natural product biosynthesis protein [Streptomyces sp. HUAS TT20]|uniref:DUF6193 family natural product biosynthesis protein n=1 Tax=Streptomyces sp. HUAS TT20 TaxID=3447509 RepID=UPI0021DAE4A6|nr:DUF6193 family natural product biosynthesis protein [Streptomyces sp. HUAS 15-9]UXY29853.1 DUF6193 family natural product biosynthesis protein [Streptomyces sp. HUAS 15-9]